MIDIHAEQLVRLSQVPKLLPPNPSSSNKVHIATVYRWVQRGRNGRKLETVKIGGTQYTSFEAIRRFAVATQQPSAPATPPTPTPTASPAKHQRRRQLVRDRLMAELGVSSGGNTPAPKGPEQENAA